MNFKTRVKKQDILDSLNKQLESHITTVKTARKKWREKMLSVAEQIVQAEGKLKTFPRALNALRNMPQSYASAIRAAIKRIELDQNEEFELDDHDYAMLMEGNWSWVSSFVYSNALYGATGPTGSTGSAGTTGVCDFGDDDDDVQTTNEIDAVLGEDELEK